MSKCVSRLDCWHSGTHNSLLEQYDRSELSGKRVLSVPTMLDFDLLFQHTDRPASKTPDSKDHGDWQKEAELLKGVLKPISWPTCSPATAQNNYIDLSLMIYLSNLDDWSLADRAWHTELLPEGEVISKDGRCLYIVRTYHRGIVVWPLVKTGANSYFFDLTCARLCIVHYFDFDAYKIVPKSAVSMLRQAIYGLSGGKGCT